MRLHRFFVEGDISKETYTSSDKGLYNQLHNVLRLKQGDEVVLCDGKSREAHARVDKISKDHIEFSLEGVKENKNEPKISATLYCSLLKRENFEWVAQKATEIGVKSIVPIQTQRTVKTSLRKDRIEKIIKEAAEQAGRGIIPTLYPPLNFLDAVNQATIHQKNIFFDVSGKAFSDVKRNYEDVGIWIGPEGGWEDQELSFTQERKFEIVMLEKLTLRAETAAVVALYSGLYY